MTLKIPGEPVEVSKARNAVRLAALEALVEMRAGVPGSLEKSREATKALRQFNKAERAELKAEKAEFKALKAALKAQKAEKK